MAAGRQARGRIVGRDRGERDLREEGHRPALGARPARALREVWPATELGPAHWQPVIPGGHAGGQPLAPLHDRAIGPQGEPDRDRDDVIAEARNRCGGVPAAILLRVTEPFVVESPGDGPPVVGQCEAHVAVGGDRAHPTQAVDGPRLHPARVPELRVATLAEPVAAPRVDRARLVEREAVVCPGRDGRDRRQSRHRSGCRTVYSSMCTPREYFEAPREDDPVAAEHKMMRPTSRYRDDAAQRVDRDRARPVLLGIHGPRQYTAAPAEHGPVLKPREARADARHDGADASLEPRHHDRPTPVLDCAVANLPLAVEAPRMQRAASGECERVTAADRDRPHICEIAHDDRRRPVDLRAIPDLAGGVVTPGAHSAVCEQRDAMPGGAADSDRRVDPGHRRRDVTRRRGRPPHRLARAQPDRRDRQREQRIGMALEPRLHEPRTQRVVSCRHLRQVRPNRRPAAT